MIKHPHHPFDDVVDIGEVASHVAMVEDIDRATGEHRIGKQKGRHVGSAPGAVDRKKAQTGGRQPEKMAVGMRHQFIGFLGRGIQTHRVVDRIVLGKRHPGVAAIHAR